MKSSKKIKNVKENDFLMFINLMKNVKENQIYIKLFRNLIILKKNLKSVEVLKV